MSDEERVAVRRRALALASWVIAPVSIVGLFVKPTWYQLWVFSIAFSLATVPRWLLKQLRHRRSRARQNR